MPPQYGNECWCGTSDVFADYEKHGLGTCHMRCAGNELEACGELMCSLSPFIYLLYIALPPQPRLVLARYD